MPEISVIVPVYRAEDFLRRAVDSVLSQAFRILNCCSLTMAHLMVAVSFAMLWQRTMPASACFIRKTEG